MKHISTQPMDVAEYAARRALLVNLDRAEQTYYSHVLVALADNLKLRDPSLYCEVTARDASHEVKMQVQAPKQNKSMHLLLSRNPDYQHPEKSSCTVKIWIFEDYDPEGETILNDYALSRAQKKSTPIPFGIFDPVDATICKTIETLLGIDPRAEIKTAPHRPEKDARKIEAPSEIPS